MATGHRAASIRITVAAQHRISERIQRVAEPVTLGVPLPSGLCADSQRLALLDRSGTPRPLQARVLDRWPDNSIRWLLVDFQADANGEPAAEYEIVLDVPSAAALSPIVTAESLGMVIVETGAARFSMIAGDAFPFVKVLVDGQPALDAGRTGFSIKTDKGAVLTPVVKTITVEESGPLRTAIRCDGILKGHRSAAGLEMTARLHFFAGSSTVRCALTLRNSRPASHPGGCWTLGDTPASALLKGVALQLGVPSGDITRIDYSVEHGAQLQTCAASLEIYQESSGGASWRSSNHVNRNGVVPMTLQGYRVRADESTAHGLRATPIVTVQSGPRTMSVAVPEFWQNFPQGIDASRDRITLRLMPHTYPDVHELQGGEQKTHTFYVAFGVDRVTSRPLEWCRSPLIARAQPSWYCESGAVAYLTPADDDRHRDHGELVKAAIEGADTFEHKRELADEYGWRNFGDTYADHEAIGAPAGGRIVSHYNNQYDGVAGFAYQFLRTGDRRWWTLMDELARHVADIDTYHTAGDKSAYNNGLFWHTFHYTDASTSTHRAYPKHPTIGGGPSAEHNYATGLMLHYFLTGTEQSRDTAIALARWVMDMDDGSRTVFRWLDRGHTGLASATGSPLYHGPGRGAGNSIATLLVGHRLTGDSACLEKAEALIRRCIHPADNIDARNLLDAERRWSYTVFLQTLGKYLDYKIEMNALDESYAYARAALLHYARWMAEHEYPYLDKPDILEYPTETWAAQDIRKSDVFTYAAKHSTGTERTCFLARAEFFYRTSLSTLRTMPTRTLARPMTLIMTNGYLHGAVAVDGPGAPAPRAAGEAFGTPAQFVPQKVRAIQRARVLAGAAAPLLAAVAALLYWVL